MKIKFEESIKYQPSILITPDYYNFNSLHPYVEITFFDWVDNNFIYRPLVKPNIYFGRIYPEESKEWGQILVLAEKIANKTFGAKSVSANQYVDIIRCYTRIAEIIESKVATI